VDDEGILLTSNHPFPQSSRFQTDHLYAFSISTCELIYVIRKLL
jgi:hypothetical protein